MLQKEEAALTVYMGEGFGVGERGGVVVWDEEAIFLGKEFEGKDDWNENVSMAATAPRDGWQKPDVRDESAKASIGQCTQIGLRM